MQQVIRCAVYTRKSVEEGLEQEFNTLDAQRMACEAYIAAKRLEGWTCLPDRYDDGGYSGGNLKRPAFQRLMDDVRADCVDMIVCYKIDRLSRSLLDFTQVFNELEKHHVSFSCVTQELNTSTSMGRMCMNLLMTFAQFERELASERTSDKMAATRRKGIWPGGTVPYGYKRIEKRLVVDPDTAPNVVKIFEWYLELGTPKLVAKRLTEKGILRFPERNKPFDTVMVATALRNCVYIGRVPLKNESFKGIHEPIIDMELWDKVAARLKTVEFKPRTERRATSPALLTGLLRCGHCGDALSYTWTGKNRSGQIRYGYYTCRKDMRRGVSTCSVKSVPAQLIEPLVESEAVAFLKTPTMLRALAGERHISPFEMRRQLDSPEEFWTSLTPVTKRELLSSIIESVTVYESSVDIKFKVKGDKRLMEEFKNEHHGN